MAEDLEKKLLKGVAYRMFVEEMQKHLLAAEAFFESGQWTAETLKEMSGRFHTIRGGAGFFKLVEIASLAGELEKGLIAGEASDVAAKAQSFRDIYENLRGAAAKAPQPAS
jgi:HPt (histidine-containing phosphotransfer) domain-containing protein